MILDSVAENVFSVREQKDQPLIPLVSLYHGNLEGDVFPTNETSTGKWVALLAPGIPY
jgi:hypothetical protein